MSAAVHDPIAVSPSDVAALLKISRQTVYALIARKELRAFKVCASTRIPLADVRALVGGEPVSGGDAG